MEGRRRAERRGMGRRGIREDWRIVCSLSFKSS